jgi:hypothetical protein
MPAIDRASQARIIARAGAPWRGGRFQPNIQARFAGEPKLTFARLPQEGRR